MSAKQHKKLRRIAIGFAAAMDSAGRKIDKGGYDTIKHGQTKNGIIEQLVSKPNSIKAITKLLKKQAAR